MTRGKRCTAPFPEELADMRAWRAEAITTSALELQFCRWGENRQPLRQLIEGGMRAVALGQDGLPRRPGDREPRIVPGDADLGCRIVQLRALVFDLGDRADDEEPVGEAGRHVALGEVPPGERDRH